MIIPKGAETVRIGPYVGFIPKHWNDLPTPMLLGVYSALLAAGYEPLKPEEVVPYQRLVVLCELIRATPADLLNLLGLHLGPDALQGEQREEVMADLNTLLDQITFCFEDITPEDDEDAAKQYRLRLDLTRCPYPKITQTKGVHYFGPRNGLENVSIYELASIFTALSAYDKSKDRADLRTLMATVYRPRKLRSVSSLSNGTGGDVRQALYMHDGLVEKRAKEWRKVHELVQSLLHFWLQCCRYQIVTHPDLAVLFERSEGGGQEDPDGWAGTLLHLAGNSIVNIDKTSTTAWPVALRQLAREKRQGEEQEARIRELARR